jgi:RHS repeat-associated protein
VLHGKNLQPFTGAVFVICSQLLDTPQENPCRYGAFASGQTYQYFDKESNLHYNWMRSYRAQDGRYTQADPIDLRGGWNKFLYAGGDSLTHIDPYGLDWITAVVGGTTGGIANGFSYYSQGCDFWKGAFNGFVGGTISGAFPNPLGFVTGSVATEYLNQRQGVMTSFPPNNSNMSPSQQSYLWAATTGLAFGSLGNMVKPTAGGLFAVGSGSGIGAITNLGGMLSGSPPPSECQCSRK